MSDSVRFRAVLQPEGAGTFIIVPEDAIERLGARGRTSVRGTVNGHAFLNQVMPYRDDSPAGKRWYMVVNRTVRSAAGGLAAGDEVDFVLEVDDEPRVVAVPAELAEALHGDEGARAAWDALPASHRNEYAGWVAEAKREETRRRRAVEAVRRVQQGRRPG